jgi:hypothetical protein
MKNLIRDVFYEIRDFIKEYALTGLFFIVVIITIYLGFAFFYPYNPIRIDSLSIDTDKARVGDEVCFKLTGEKFMAIPVHASIDLVNGEGISIINYVANNPPGTSFPKRCFNIPMMVKTNNYRLRFSGIYPINGFRNILKTEFSKSIHITNDIERGTQGDQGIQGKRGPRGFTGAKGGIIIFGK